MKKFLLTFCVFVSFLSVVAQEVGLPIIRNYLPKEFIYSPQVYSAIQDPRGIMYFGITDFGVIEYDGVDWRGIPTNLKSEVYGLALDQNGRIYLSGTNDFGYITINNNGKEEFFSLKHLVGDSTNYIGNVWNVHVIGDTAYFFTERCIYQYLIARNKIHKILPDQGTTFYVPFVFNNKYYILHSQNGIYCFDGNIMNPIAQTKFFSQNIFLSVLPYDEKSILIPTRTAGLFVLDLSGGKAPLPLELKPSNDFIANNNIYTSLLVDKFFVLGSMKKGALIMDKQGRSIQQINESKLLQNNLVLSSAKDFSNNVWLTLSNGISKTELSQDINYWNKNCRLDGIVYDITRFNDKIYVVTNQQVYSIPNEINLSDGKNNPRNVTEIQDIPPGQNWCLYHFQVPQNSIPKIGKKELLLAGTQNGIFEIIDNRAKQVYKSTLHSFAILQSTKNPYRIFSTDGFTDFISLRFENSTWVKEGKWTGINDDIRSIIEDKNGDLWLGTFTNGIIHLKVDQNSITHPKLIKHYKTSDGLPSLNGCKPFIFKGRIVFGTEKGLYILNPKTDRFEPFSEIGQQFCDGTIGIENFVEMPNGNIYLSSKNSNNGKIGYLTPDSKGGYNWIYKPFSRFPDMAIIQAMYADNNGTIWLGGNEGLFSYDPKKDVKNYDLNFDCLVRKVSIGKDSVIYWGNSAESNRFASYVISNSLNNIKFSFAAPFFDEEEKTKYSYYLEGYDDTWSDWSTTTYKEYTKVKEGKYTFKVKAQNIYDKISTTTEFAIRILPPWYRSIWAYIFYSLAVVGMYIFSTRSYSRILISQKLRLEKTVNERTTEIRLQKDEIQSQAEEMAAQSEELQEQADTLKRINEELEKLSIVARETDNAIIIMNAKGQFLWVNDGFSRLHGQSSEEYFAKYKDIFESSSAPNIKEIIQDCFDSKHSVVYESTVKSNQSKNIYLQTTITPILNSSGEIEKLIAIDSDISKLKEAEFEIIQKNEEITSQKEELEKHRYHLEQIVKERTAQLEVAKNRAEESDRLKSAFLANMSHEIRTPMNAIIGFSNLLNNPDISAEERDEFSLLMVNSGNTLLQLIDDIIDIAKIEAGQMTIEMKNCDLNELLRGIFMNFTQKKTAYQNKPIEFRLNLGVESSPFVIQTDPLRLQQVLMNLIDNAFKFTEKGYIEFGYQVYQNSQKPSIKFFVKDSGIGLKLEEQKHIFDRFTKIENNTSKLYRGTGLGLAISKNIVSLMEGELGVESELNYGSTFYFTIPLKTRENNTIGSKSSISKKYDYNWNTKTLLVAEDENSNFRLIEVLLKRTNVNILRANDGKEAIKQVENNRIDLILMDIKMPEMDGLEATRQIKKINKNLPIIALTAFAMQNDEALCIEAGCDDYIAKPILQDKLFSLLNKYLS